MVWVDLIVMLLFVRKVWFGYLEVLFVSCLVEWSFVVDSLQRLWGRRGCIIWFLGFTGTAVLTVCCLRAVWHPESFCVGCDWFGGTTLLFGC